MFGGKKAKELEEELLALQEKQIIVSQYPL